MYIKTDEKIVVLENYEDVHEAFVCTERWDYDCGEIDLCGSILAGYRPYTISYEVSFLNDDLRRVWDCYEKGYSELKHHVFLNSDGNLSVEDGVRDIESDVYYRVLVRLFEKYRTVENLANFYTMEWYFNKGNPYYTIINKQDRSDFKIYVSVDWDLYINLICNIYNQIKKINAIELNIDQEKNFTI